jgi:hypothetical protein
MTTSRQFADSEGEFAPWKDHPDTCKRMIDIGVTEPVMTVHMLRDEGHVQMVCGAAVQYRSWESSDGAYEDYQFRCARGHMWWIDGIDS